MNEKTRKFIVYMTLPAALIWAAFNYPVRKSTPTSVAANTQENPPAVAALAPARPDTRLINIESETAEDWGHDPFRTYLTSGEKAPQQKNLAWILKGIVYSPDQPLAFINNQSVRVGDVIDDATVISITRKAVVVSHKGKEITLTVNKG